MGTYGRTIGRKNRLWMEFIAVGGICFPCIVYAVSHKQPLSSAALAGNLQHFPDNRYWLKSVP